MRSRRWVKISGLSPPSKLGVFNNSVDVAYKALAERYYFCETAPGVFQPALRTDWAHFADPNMLEFLESVCANLELLPELSVDEVADCYKGVKRELYRQAARKYWSDGVRKADATLKMFVKFEKCDLTKAPRVINPRSAVYNVALGKWLKVNEHAYFDAIAKVLKQPIAIFKGMDVQKQAEAMQELWDSVSDCIGIGADAKKFDMHVSVAALMFEHLFYLRPLCQSLDHAMEIYSEVRRDNFDCCEAYEGYHPAYRLAWLLVQQLDNRGTGYFADGKIKFRMRGTRASGDLNTSLGNCILMCAMTYAWSKQCGVDFKLANNGDDCMHMIRRCDEAKWRDGLNEFFAAKGFRMVLEPTVEELQEVEFCQSKPCRTIEGIKMVRNPLTLITKGSMCLLPVNNMKSLRKWMMAVGVAEGSLNRGVPVIQAFARAMRRNGVRCTRSWIDRTYYQSNRAYHADLVVDDMIITDQARVDFYTSWGITPQEQLHLEKYYDNWQLGDTFGVPALSFEALERASDMLVGVPNLLIPAI